MNDFITLVLQDSITAGVRVVAVSFWDSPVVIAFLTVTLPLLVNQYLQAKKTRSDAKDTALEVKADLHAAKADLQAQGLERKEKLESVAVLVNGERAAKELRIRELEARLRQHGVSDE